jgi:ABC-2 type transport system ATP-binding protein
MSSVAIETFDLTRHYSKIPAVDNVSFQVQAGTVFGLLGPNGAGKSTTIKMLTTLLPVTSGTALIMGYDLVHDPALIREQIGYVPQVLSADGDLTGYENLVLSAKLYGLSRSYQSQRISEVLGFMGLEAYADRLVSQYSGGMIRKLEIAQGVLHSPAILFLDEPTIGLDPMARKALWERILEWRKHFKTTIFLTTHDMDEADRLCDRVAFMHLGKIVVLDTPAKLKATVGPHATLDDVFMRYTGTSVNPSEYQNVKQTRRTISHLD